MVNNIYLHQSNKLTKHKTQLQCIHYQYFNAQIDLMLVGNPSEEYTKGNIILECSTSCLPVNNCRPLATLLNMENYLLEFISLTIVEMSGFYYE